MTFPYPWVQATVAHRRVRGLHGRHPVDPLLHMEERGWRREANERGRRWRNVRG